jgi:uncharacterized protein (DUF58 family)
MSNIFLQRVKKFFALQFLRARPLPAVHQVRLQLRRIYIIPTRHGLLFALALLVMLLGSINYNNNMGFVLTFLLGGMALIGILHTYRNLAGLQLLSGRAAPVFVGESAYFGILLDNRNHPARYALRIYTQNNPSTRLDIDVAAHQMQHIALAVTGERRGRLALPVLRIETEFPLGLFRAWSDVHLDIHCLIYPRPGGSYQLPTGTPENSLGHARYSEGGEDFNGYRAYTLSDSPRHVDWKIVAREQGWYIKQFGGHSGTRLWLNWHDSGSSHVEMALSQLCRWVIEAEAQQISYGLNIPTCRLPPSLGQAHYHQCLESLALYGLTHDFLLP